MLRENLEEEGLEKNPNLHLAQLKYLLTVSEYHDDKQIIARIMEAVKKDGEYLILLPKDSPNSISLRHGTVVRAFM